MKATKLMKTSPSVISFAAIGGKKKTKDLWAIILTK